MQPSLKRTDLQPTENFVKIIQELEEVILAGSGADSFRETVKLLYAKLYDEKYTRENDLLVFQTANYREEAIFQNITTLFEKAKQTWPEVFSPHETLSLTPAHITVCVRELQHTKLLDTNLSVLDAAFEYLLPTVAKGNRGQYFTPRHVITTAIKMLNPKKSEYIIDPAAGSGGFLLESIQWVGNKKQFAADQVYGIDFDDRAYMVCRAMMLIAGLGNDHIYKRNSLEPVDPDLLEKFDLVLTNPPFGGEVKDPILLQKYELAKDKNGNQKAIVERHILFLERILQFLKPNGRAAIIVPQGILNNTNLSYLREWLFQHARILGVIGLDTNVFKPFTNVKTSLLLLQKWEDTPILDYPIFMAVSQNSGKNASGITISKNGIIQSDLENIAEEFIKFSKKEQLQFWT